MKKLLSVLLSVALIITALPFGAFNLTASAATSGITGDCTWTLDGTVLTISGNGNMANYTNYDTPWGYDLTEVIIEDGVTNISTSTFRSCTSLTNIIIPNSVMSIGEAAFYNTGYYNNSANWENNVLYIGDHLIEAKNSISGSYEIKSGTITIADKAFYYCKNLTSITIPDSVNSIGYRSFDDTGYYNNSANWENNVLYIGDHLIEAKNSISGSYEIKSGTITIADRAFYNCSNLTSITIPDRVTSIGDYAFYNCSNLTSITIPDRVTSIGDYAFYSCYSLENVYITDIVAWCNISFSNASSNPLCSSYHNEPLYCTKKLYLNGNLVTDLIIPSGVTSIGDYSFSGCSSIENVIISDSVMSIGNRAFASCGNLISVDIGDNVSNIADYAFYGCSSLTNVIIPGSVTKIGNSVFRYCARLTSITIPDSVTNIGELAFDECDNLENVYITDLNAWCNINFDFKLETYTPDGFYEHSEYGYASNPLYYADFLFLNNKPVTNVVVPEGITEITPYMFDFCTLKKITLPEGITTIGEKAFASCEILTDINIPKSVTNIEEDAFEDCQSLKNVYI